jgi:hypothetical protein
MNKHTRSFLLAAAALLAVCSASAQALVGAWTYGNTASPTSTGTGAFVFMSNGVYFHMESDNVDDAANGQNGMERGTYTWNPGTGLFTLNSLAVNTNGQWGLSHGLGVGNSFTLDVTGDTANSGQLSRVTGGSAIVGAWTYGNTLTPTSAGTGVFVFLANGVYFHAESENLDDSANGQNGMERGTYTWNSGSGAFAPVANFVDTNGGWGMADNSIIGSGLNIQISGNTLTVDGGPFTMTRVAAIPEPSTYAALAGLGVLGLAIWRRRKTQASA